MHNLKDVLCSVTFPSSILTSKVQGLFDRGTRSYNLASIVMFGMDDSSQFLLCGLSDGSVVASSLSATIHDALDRKKDQQVRYFGTHTHGYDVLFRECG